MHDEFVVDEIEAVRSSLIWIVDHVIHELLGELWELVDVFAVVSRIRNTESEFEVKTFQETILEEVTFDHSEVTDWFASNFEFDSCSHSFELQEVWSESVTNISSRFLWWLLVFLLFWFCDFEENMLSIKITNLEFRELDVVDICRR